MSAPRILVVHTRRLFCIVKLVGNIGAVSLGTGANARKKKQRRGGKRAKYNPLGDIGKTSVSKGQWSSASIWVGNRLMHSPPMLDPGPAGDTRVKVLKRVGVHSHE